jgi:hypothetical protein
MINAALYLIEPIDPSLINKYPLLDQLMFQPIEPELKF